jgi:hypothetical protein
MSCKFELGDSIVCIKDTANLKFGSYYQIKGMGNLSMNADTKEGFGFCIEDQSKYVRGRYGLNPVWYYFTEKEMSNLFITSEEHYQSYIRNQKINEIIK